MTWEDWGRDELHAFAVVLRGDRIHGTDRYGEALVDDSFVLLFNPGDEAVLFTLPDLQNVPLDAWEVESELSEAVEPGQYEPGESLLVDPHTMAVLRACVPDADADTVVASAKESVEKAKHGSAAQEAKLPKADVKDPHLEETGDGAAASAPPADAGEAASEPTPSSAPAAGDEADGESSRAGEDTDGTAADEPSGSTTPPSEAEARKA